MNNFDMSNFVTEEEMKEQEAQQQEQEVLKNFDRQIFSPDSTRIIEIVKNIFEPAQAMDPTNDFWEATDNCIKWDINQLATNPSQFVVVEGLLSHRLQAGLLTDMFTDESGVPFKALPGNSPALKSTAFLGGIKDEKTLDVIKENVVKVAGISILPDSENIAIFHEPISANLPGMLGYCIALINLDPTQLMNLKRASKVKKVSDKANKVFNNASTSTYCIAKNAVDGIAVPAVEVGAKFAGLAAGGIAVGAAKGAAQFASEMSDAALKIVEIKESDQIKNIKNNCAQIAAKFGKNSAKDDSFSFNF